MRAMVIEKWGEQYRLEDRPDPEPNYGEAVMKVHSAGVGLTLLIMRNGTVGGETPRVMGHELGGEIVDVGPGVNNVKVGDRCTVYFYLNCGVCRWCRNGRETLCENHGGFVGVHRDGGFADFVCLPAQNYLPIPDDLTYEAAAIAADAVNTSWHCMKERAQINPHDDVLLIGAGGGVGIHGVQVANLFGARIIAVDVSEEKLDLASQWGANTVINSRTVNDLAAEVMRLTDGKGVDAAIDFVGATETFQTCIDSLARAGRAVVVGAQPGEIKISPTSLMLDEKIVTGSRH